MNEDYQSGPLRSRWQDGTKSAKTLLGECLHERKQERSWKRLREPSYHNSSEKRRFSGHVLVCLVKGSQGIRKSLRKVSHQRPALVTNPAAHLEGTAASKRLQEWTSEHSSWALGQFARCSRCILMAPQWYNSSLWLWLSFLLKLRAKIVKHGLAGHLSPDLHLMSSRLSCQSWCCLLQRLAPDALQIGFCQLLKWCCRSRLVTDVIDKDVYQLDLYLRVFSGVSLICDLLFSTNRIWKHRDVGFSFQEYKSESQAIVQHHLT